MVQVQSFSLTPRRQRWFIVSVETASCEVPAVEVPPSQHAAKASILRQFAKLEAQRKEELHVLNGQIIKSDHTR